MPASRLLTPSPDSSPSGVIIPSVSRFSSCFVHKFGGSSLSCAEFFLHVASLVCEEVSRSVDERLIIVVSAPGEFRPSAQASAVFSRFSPLLSSPAFPKVTDALIAASELAASGESYENIVESLKTRQNTLIRRAFQLAEQFWPLPAEFFGSSQGEEKILAEQIREDFKDLSSLLRSLALTKSLGAHSWWFGLGELWSARLLTALVRRRLAFVGSPAQASFGDSREFIFLQPPSLWDVSSSPHGVSSGFPDLERSAERFSHWLGQSGRSESAVLVVTGYLAATSEGAPTTLGRDGSDYSAAILGALTKSREVFIWSDVDGVYSANPTKVAGARLVAELSYDEAAELAYFGAKILHPKTVAPLADLRIIIRLKNSFNPQASGTAIRGRNNNNQQDQTTCGVKGVTDFSDLCLLQVEGTGLIGVPGVAQRLFAALARVGCSVALITQAGSEHSICLALPLKQGQIGLKAVREEFEAELRRRQLSAVDFISPVSCLAIVGDGMRARPGVAGRFFSALAEEGVNILAIAQGASERNISVIIKQEDVERALNAAHRKILEA